MNTPLVSVVMPVYNAEKYLNESMKSILFGTYENLELICVDDGSTDHSAAMIEDAINSDDRIKLICQKNQYSGVARNHGFSQASGKYVMFLDADDCFAPELLERMVRTAEKYSADIVICECEGFDDEGNNYYIAGNTLAKEFLPDSKVFSSSDIPDDIFRLTGGESWDKLFRAEFLRSKHIRYIDTAVAQDGYFSTLALAEAERITTLNEKLIRYRKNSNTSAWKKRGDVWKEVFRMLEMLQKELSDRGFFPALKRSYLNMALRYICTLILGGISNNTIYMEFCNYLKKAESENFHFLSYAREYYDDGLLYDHLYHVIHLRPEEAALRIFSSAYDQMLGVIQRVDFHIHKQDEVIKLLDGIVKAKKWYIKQGILSAEMKVAVYGYGDVGRDYCNQIRSSKEWEFAGVFDKNADMFVPDEFTVLHPYVISQIEFDRILIAVTDELIAKNIKEELLHIYCVPEYKIIWPDPEGRMKKDGKI